MSKSRCELNAVHQEAPCENLSAVPGEMEA